MATVSTKTAAASRSRRNCPSCRAYCPFLTIIGGVLYVLYGGVPTPSEAAGVGAMLVLVLVAVIYKVWQPSRIWKIISDSMK